MSPPEVVGSGPSPNLLNCVSNNTHRQWWKDPGLRKLNLLLMSGLLGSITTGFDSSLIGGLLANKVWFENLKLTSTNLLGLLIAAQSLGGVIALLPAPWLADILGRRKGIMLANILVTGTIIGQTFCQTAIQFLGTRLLLGCLINVNIISSTAMVLELAHPRQRAVVGALYNTFFFVGSITAAWTSFGALNISNSSWTWRLPVIMQALWSVIQLTLAIFCPESPRWLVNNNRAAEARAILVKYHANGDEDDELVSLEFSEICASIELEKESKNVGWASLVSTPGNRKRLIICLLMGLSVQWVGNGIVSYYFAPVLKTVGIESATQQQGINGGLQIYNWFISIAGALLAERAGRRKLLLLSTVSMLVFMTMVTICSAVYAHNGNASAGYAVIVFLFLFLGGYVIGFTPIPILYVNEIWPTNLRAKGVSIFYAMQALALCFNQYVNPIALAAIQWKYYFVYVGVLVGVILFIFFYVPETKGRSLEEVGGIFDGEQAAVLAQTTATLQEKNHEVQVTTVEHAA